MARDAEMNDRLMDLLGTSDAAMGEDEKISYKNAVEKGISNVRFAVIFIENQYGQLWIPRWSEDGGRLAGAMDVSGRYPVFSGENYEKAANDFFKKEMLCDPMTLDVSFTGKGSPFDGTRTSVFVNVFRAVMDRVPENYSARFAESGYYHAQQIFDWIWSGSSATVDLRNLLAKFYADRIRKLRVGDFLDFDPEESIIEAAGEYLNGCCKESESMENARKWAEKKVEQKIKEVVEERLKNYPANCPVFSNILKPFSIKEMKARSPEMDSLEVETQGFLSFYWWPAEKRFAWCEAAAKRFGIDFRRYVFKETYVCVYSGRNDYKARGSNFVSIELPGKEPSLPNRELSSVENSISIRRNREWSNDGEIETATTAVTIYDVDVLPVKIHWYSQDIYSAKYAGTQGSSQRHITEISLSGSGEFQVNRIHDV